MAWDRLLIAEPEGPPPSSLVQLRSAVWTGDARDTRPKLEMVMIFTNACFAPLADLIAIPSGITEHDDFRVEYRYTFPVLFQ